MRKSLVACLLVLGVLPVAAKESPRFGIQVGVVDPQGDLKDAVNSKKGFTLGAHFTFDMGNDLTLRPRLDYTHFPSWDESSAGSDGFSSYQSSLSLQFTNMSLGVDLLVPPGNQKQFYFIGGLSYIAWKGKVSGYYRYQDPYNGNQELNENESKTWNKLGVSIGAGTHLGERGFAELRYTMSKFGEDDSSANLLALSVGFRF